ncbi:MAG: type II toxin-antitoxin system prevent-host-death family antitoxin [Salinicola sp.]|uniref:type II toxin-antitoxin system Phd/YefM family antitoxin n=1 Tax=Salinicola sp. TaxID=1978524 RepID=UPI001DF618B3|nr:type II toxin-antitoxin system prevent-host-death family antitoxin [Salinicola sp.]NRB56586.1 type II toxin-antitoxin system prevent-host-death family antitoxin [Salinicola sp.]
MPLNEVSKSEFKAKALEILRQVEASGEPLVITDKGRPTIEVRRYRTDQRSPLERLKGSVVELSDPFEPVGEDEWEALV